MTTTHIEKQNSTSTPENRWHLFQLIPLHCPHINHYPDFKYHIWVLTFFELNMIMHYILFHVFFFFSLNFMRFSCVIPLTVVWFFIGCIVIHWINCITQFISFTVDRYLDCVQFSAITNHAVTACCTCLLTWVRVRFRGLCDSEYNYWFT